MAQILGADFDLGTRMGKEVNRKGTKDSLFEKFINVVDTPRAAVMSAIKELDDLTEGEGASFDDWKQQTKDHIGFGQVLEQSKAFEGGKGNIWLKRALGLTGDIVFDPLTYLTGGANKITGGAKVTAKSLGRAGLKEGGRKGELGARVLQGGTSALTTKELAELGARAGLKLGGVPILPHGVTRHAGRAVQRLGSAARGASEGAKLANTLGGAETSAKALLRSGDPRLAKQGLDLLDQKALSTARGDKLANEWSRELRDVLKPFKNKELRPVLRNALELGPDSDPWKQLVAQGKDPQAARGWFDKVRTAANEELGAKWINDFDNYFTHIATPEAKQRLGGRARSGTAGKIPPEVKRQYTAGKDFLGTKLETGTIDEIQEIAKKEFGKDAIKLFVDDPIEAMSTYAKIMGKATSRRLLEQGLQQAGHITPVLDDATSVARTALAGADDATEFAKVGADEALDLAPEGQIASGAQEGALLPSDPLSSVVQPPVGTAGAVPPSLSTEVAEGITAAADDVADQFDQTGAALRRAGREDPLAQTAALGAQADAVPVPTEKQWNKVTTALRLPNMQENAANMITDSMRTFAINGAKFEAPEWMAEAMYATSKMNDPNEWNKLLNMWDGLTSFWKRYAILTPGFHFRNAFGGVANNYVGDFTLASHYSFSKGYLKRGSDPLVERIMDLGILGEGQAVSESSIGAARRGLSFKNPLSPDFAPIRASRRVGNTVETHLRGAVAYDVMKRGGSPEDAIDAINKFHFDYNDLSNFEAGTARRLIPFYTWTRKNLPLQLEMMVRKPGKYVKYAHVKRNVELGTEEEGIVPSYFGELSAIRTPWGKNDGSRQYLTPDLPFQQIAKTFDLGQLLSSVNPIIKAPLELQAGKQFFSDVPFTEGLKPAPTAWGPLLPVLGAVGYAKKSKSGEWMISDKTAYLVEQGMPLLGRARRLAPSEERYQQRVTSSWLSTIFGIGIRTNTLQGQESELRRRSGNLDTKLKELESLGVRVPGRPRRKPGPN